MPATPRPRFVATTPERLRLARTCYDRLAGTLGVAMHDAMLRQGWFATAADGGADLHANADGDYRLSEGGAAACVSLGLDLAQAQRARRRFACGCLDWSERRDHLGGALGAALLAQLLGQGWLERDYSSRALTVTRAGRRRFKAVFAIDA